MTLFSVVVNHFRLDWLLAHGWALAQRKECSSATTFGRVAKRHFVVWCQHKKGAWADSLSVLKPAWLVANQRVSIDSLATMGRKQWFVHTGFRRLRRQLFELSGFMLHFQGFSKLSRPCKATKYPISLPATLIYYWRNGPTLLGEQTQELFRCSWIMLLASLVEDSDVACVTSVASNSVRSTGHTSSHTTTSYSEKALPRDERSSDNQNNDHRTHLTTNDCEVDITNVRDFWLRTFSIATDWACQLPQQLSNAFANTTVPIRPCTIRVEQIRQRQSAQSSSQLSSEKNKALALLDCLSKSGLLSLQQCQWHMIVTQTVCFPTTVMQVHFCFFFLKKK